MDTQPVWHYEFIILCIFHARIIDGFAYLDFIHNPAVNWLGLCIQIWSEAMSELWPAECWNYE